MFLKSSPDAVDLILREYYLDDALKVAHDRVASVSEMIGYEPPQNVASYVFIGMKKDSVKDNPDTNGRTLCGEVMQEGVTIHVGEVVDCDELLNVLSKEKALMYLSALQYDFAKGVCQHTDGSFDTVYENEQVYNLKAKIFTSANTL